MEALTWFIIGVVVGVYRKEIYILIKKEYDKPSSKKAEVK